MLKNYYQILGLNPDCTKDDIKKAYRIYATKFHPDKQNNDKFFEDKFKEIKEAYDNLIEDNKRADYDLLFNVSYSNFYNKSPDNDLFNELGRINQEREQKERIKRKRILYTSKDLIINGLYINCCGRSYELSDYDKSTIRKDDNSNFVFIGILMIIIGIITIAFFVGILLLLIGIYGLFYKEYYVVLIGKQGDLPLIKGRKSKMKKISKIINRAIEEN